MITESQIKAAIRSALTRPKQRIELKDDGERGAGRLAIMVRAHKGRVSAEWYAVYYRGERRRMAKLGAYPAMSLADARKKFREEYAPAISTGAEPTRKIVRVQNAKGGATVADLFRAYIEHLRRAAKRSTLEVERTLLGTRNGEPVKSSSKGGIAGVSGASVLAARVGPDDIVPALAEIHGRGAPAMAAAARAYLSAAFAFGMKASHDYTSTGPIFDWGIKSNPLDAIGYDPHATSPRDRNLSPEEFRKFWMWLVERDERSCRAKATRLLMATGQRVEEILRLGHACERFGKSVYLQDEKMLFWDKTKNGRPHSIPLTPQASDLLDGMRVNRHGLYFPNARDAKRFALASSVGTLVNTFVEESGVAPFVPKDIRRTWKTLAGRAGLSKEIRDKLQNHAQGRDVSSRHYDRYDYLLEKRAAVQRWSEYLDRILAGTLKEGEEGNVVQLIDARAAAA